MSADNWAVCPKCKNAESAKLAKAVRDAGEAYGKVPAAEYLKLLEAAERDVKLDPTLREDYEIGIDENGEFSIGYRASCARCGLSFRYSHAENIPQG